MGIASGNIPAHRRRNRHSGAAVAFWRPVRSTHETTVGDIRRTAEVGPLW